MTHCILSVPADQLKYPIRTNFQVTDDLIHQQYGFTFKLKNFVPFSKAFVASLLKLLCPDKTALVRVRALTSLAPADWNKLLYAHLAEDLGPVSFML